MGRNKGNYVCVTVVYIERFGKDGRDGKPHCLLACYCLCQERIQHPNRGGYGVGRIACPDEFDVHRSAGTS